jgi:hypothetical protein
MAFARRLVENPSDTDQRYILWSNGYIKPLGTALPISQVEGSVSISNGSDAPTFYTAPQPDQAVAIQVIDWTVPKGYTLTHYGHVWAWGGAPTVPGAPGGSHFLTTGPEYLWGAFGGFGSPVWGFVSDFVMNPAGDGTGYLLTYGGDVFGIGTGVPAISHSAMVLGQTVASRIVMDWASKRYWVLDGFGRVFGMNGGNDVGVGGNAALARLNDLGYAPAAIQLYDKAATPKGWFLDQFGRMLKVGTADVPHGYRETLSAQQWIDFQIVDDGTAVDPLRLANLTRQGTQFEFVSSTAPVVDVVGPTNASTVTDTTRPYVAWSYVDAENDPQASYEVRVFTAAQYGAGGFNSATSAATWETSGTDQSVRRVQIGVELANTGYRAYVFTTEPSGLASAADYTGWTQTVTPPSTPTVAATAGAGLDGIDLALHVSTVGLDPDAVFGVEYHDVDWDGTTWEWVRGGYDIAPDGSGDATITDPEPRFGVARTYRALVYIYDASLDTWNASAWSATNAATLGPTDVWALSNPFAPSMDVLVEPTEDLVAPKRQIIAGVFWPVDREEPIVVSGGPPKAPSFTVGLYALSAAQRSAIEALLDADVVLLLRDPLGRAFFFRAIDDTTLTTDHTASGSRTDETHVHELRCQTVRRPTAGPPAGPLAGS